jgi:hypothetical protein
VRKDKVDILKQARLTNDPFELEQLIKNGDKDVLLNCVLNRNLSAKQFENLVPLYVANSKNEESIIKILDRFQQPNLALAAIANPNVTERVLEHIKGIFSDAKYTGLRVRVYHEEFKRSNKKNCNQNNIKYITKSIQARDLSQERYSQPPPLNTVTGV